MTTSNEVHCGGCAMQHAFQAIDVWFCPACGRHEHDKQLIPMPGGYRVISAKNPTSKEQLERAVNELAFLTSPVRLVDRAVALALPQWSYGDRTVRFFNAGPYYEGAADRIGITDIKGGWQNIPGTEPLMLVPRFTDSYDAAMRLAGNELNRRIEFGTIEEGNCWAYAHLNDDALGEVEAAFNEPTAIAMALLKCIITRVEAQAQEAEAV